MRGTIDRAAAWVLMCVAAFCFFLWATGSILAASVMTLVLMVCTRRVGEGLRRRVEARKARRRLAGSRLSEWMCADPAQAAMEAARVVCLAFHLPAPEQDGDSAIALNNGVRVRLELAQWSRLGRPFDASDVLARYAAHRGEEALVLMITSPAQPKAIPFARTLKGPKVRVIDAPLLTDWLAEQQPAVVDTLKPKPVAREKGRLATALRALAASVRPSRLFKYGLLLLGMYLALGSIAYLPASMVLMLLAGFSLKRSHAGKVLI